MPDQPTRNQTGGGAATGGGMNFQAAVTAVVGVHLLRATPLEWLNGITVDVPVTLSAETNGPGDDVQVTLVGGHLVEIQAKKGLKRGPDLWASLEKLADGVNRRLIDYGVLAVAPDSSRTVQIDLAGDLVRLGQGRTDRLTEIGAELHRRLLALGLNVTQICSNLRIRVVHVLFADGLEIKSAKEALRSVCVDEDDASEAWNILYADACLLVELRGKHTRSDLIRILNSERIEVKSRSNERAPDNIEDPIVLSHRIVLAIEKGVIPSSGGPIMPKTSIVGAGQILEQYRGLPAVAHMDDHLLRKSDEFVGKAFCAIEKVRLLSRTSGSRQPEWLHAEKALDELKTAQINLKVALKPF